MDPTPISQDTVMTDDVIIPVRRAKRTLFLRMPARKRLRFSYRRRSRLVRYKPEMKMQDFNLQGAIADGALSTVQELTAIAEGSGANERHGNRVRIHRVEIRGTLGDDAADFYLMQCHTTTVPSYVSFIAYQGGHTTVDTTNTQFTEWRYMNGKQFKDKGGCRHSFRMGYTAKYNAALSTSCVDNRLVFFVKNDTGGSITAELTGRVWYTDA